MYGLAQPPSVIVDNDPHFGIERKTWHHVLRVQVCRSYAQTVVRWLSRFMRSTVVHHLARWFPAPFLPDTVIIKGSMLNWGEEFDNVVRIYERLSSIQGSVIPVCYGIATIYNNSGDTASRALVLSDVGEIQLAAVSYEERDPEQLRAMVRDALGSIYRLGILPCDANLVNCHMVGDRVMVVDHEPDQEIEDDDEISTDQLIDSAVRRIMAPSMGRSTSRSNVEI